MGLGFGGFGVQDLGLGVWGWGFRIWGLRWGSGVGGLGCGGWGLGLGGDRGENAAAEEARRGRALEESVVRGGLQVRNRVPVVMPTIV